VPKQRRVVDPCGELIFTEDRGTMMGNRGILHNAAGQIEKKFAHRNWVCCLTHFPRVLAEPRKYTKLFFLDEATALAAGHRPCGTCRRMDYDAFFAAWGRAHGRRPVAKDMDDQLHRERIAPRPQRPLDSLPPGAMIEWDGAPYLVRPDSLWLWTPGGYTTRLGRPAGQTVRLLTPVSIVNTLAAGYVPKCGVFSAPLL